MTTLNRLCLTAILVAIVSFGCRSTERSPTATQPSIAQAATTHRFESEIEAFEKSDKKTPPPAHPILFVGSSTIRFWEANQAFPTLPILNRGFGGSEVSDVLFYFDRVVQPYQPKTIVFYAGDNDLNSGKSVDRVVADTRTFIDRVRQGLPQARLIVVGIKPSPSRWRLIEQMRDTNRQVKKMVESKPGDLFLDPESKILGPDGKPEADLFRIDALHLNAKGYDRLNDLIRPALQGG